MTGKVFYKQASAVESVSDTDRRVRFCISTNDVDRDNDTIDQSGWDLSNYMRSPVVLWAHSHHDLPIAKCVMLGVENGKLMATAEFATHAFAETVYQLVKGGFLSATSVGFRTLEYVRNEQRNGIDFKRMELLEFSVVPVPANQHALIAAAADGADLAPLRDWVERTVEAWPEPLALKAAARSKLAAETPAAVDAEEFRALAKAVAALAADVATIGETVCRIDTRAVAAEKAEGQPEADGEKRGRVLSRANEAALRKAHECAAGCSEHIGKVLAALQPEEEPEEEAAASGVLEVKDAEYVIDLVEAEADGDLVDVDAGELRELMRAAIAEGFGTVRAEAERAMNVLRGRVD